MFLSHTPPLHSCPLLLHFSFDLLLTPPVSPPTPHFVHLPLVPFLLSYFISCLRHPEFFFICTSSSLPLLSSHLPILLHLVLLHIRLPACLLPPLFNITFSLPSLHPFPSSFLLPLLCSAPPQRAPGASPSAHNISSAAVSDRPNFSRGVGIRSTFHAGQQRGARDQQGSAYPGGPASPSLSHGNSQARRTHGATGIFSKFTSKFVRR